MIKIKDIEIYHPERKVSNDFYLKDNESHKYFLETILGKEERYVKDDNENTLTFMKKAAEKVLNKSKLTGEDIDMVVCCTQTPEFFIPPMSAVLHNHLNIKNNSAFYDINVACIGMVFAFDQVYNMMLNNKDLNKVLIVGCDLLRQFIHKESNNYGNYGDTSCAIILEKDNEKDCSKLIETKHFADTNQKHCILFPPFKLSELTNSEKNDNIFKMSFPDNLKTDISLVKEKLTEILNDNNVQASDIAMLCCSQGALVAVESIRNYLQINEENCLFVGKNYGYNACASPFIVLYEAIKQGKVKRGDYVLFWTFGAGSQHIISLIKY